MIIKNIIDILILSFIIISLYLHPFYSLLLYPLRVCRVRQGLHEGQGHHGVLRQLGHSEQREEGEETPLSDGH